MKIYVASSWRNHMQQGIVAALRSAGQEVYDFKNPGNGHQPFRWLELDPKWREWTPAEFRNALSIPIAEESYASDFAAMVWADACVLVLPCGRSAHLEAGWFAGAGKPLYILVLGKEEPELMYRMATKICVSMNELFDALKIPNRDTHETEQAHEYSPAND